MSSSGCKLFDALANRFLHKFLSAKRQALQSSCLRCVFSCSHGALVDINLYS